MRVDELHGDSDERSARLSWAGDERRLRVRVPAEFAVAGDDLTQFVPVALLLAMRLREPLEIDGPVSGQLLDALPETQELLSAWAPTFARVPVRAVALAPAVVPAGGHVCFFSRGIDSTYSAARPRRDADRLTRLVHVEGFDPSYGPETTSARRDAARVAADVLGLPLTVAATNLPEVLAGVVDFEDGFGVGLATLALSLAGGTGRVTLASARDYGGLLPMGSHPLLDSRWSSERVAIAHDAPVLDRPGKIAWLARERPDLLPHLYTCWQTDTAGNCGSCHKCVGTMVMLELAGALASAGSFPAQLDLGRVRELGYPELITRLGLNDVFRSIPPGARFAELRDALEQGLRRSASASLDDDALDIASHLTRYFGALVEGRPYPVRTVGSRLPRADVGPLAAGWADGAPAARAGLTAALDRPRRAHVYAVGASAAGEPLGELGAVLTEEREDTVPLELDERGLPRLAAAPRRARAGATARWVAAPLGWSGAALPARLRSVARRALDAGRSRRRGADGERAWRTVGWLHAWDGVPRRLPLYAAAHPVLEDVLLTTDPAEPARLGYEAPALLGHLDAEAPATGVLGVRRAALPWAERWGAV